MPMKRVYATGLVFFAVALTASALWYSRARPQSTQAPVSNSSSRTLPPQHPSEFCTSDGTIKSVAGPSKSTLYLLCIPLSTSNVAFNDPRTLESFADGGQFQVILQPSTLPVSTLGCSGIIARMAWTDPASDGAPADIAAKKGIFDAIGQLKSNPTAQLNVPIELNPYVKVVQNDPLQLQLTECNVFFRANPNTGHFIPNMN